MNFDEIKIVIIIILPEREVPASSMLYTAGINYFIGFYIFFSLFSSLTLTCKRNIHNVKPNSIRVKLVNSI